MCEYCENKTKSLSFSDFISSLLEEPETPAYGQPSSYSSFFDQYVKPKKEQPDATGELSEAGRDVLGYIRCKNIIGTAMTPAQLTYIGEKAGITETDKPLLAKAQLSDLRKRHTGQPGGAMVNPTSASGIPGSPEALWSIGLLIFWKRLFRNP